MKLEHSVPAEAYNLRLEMTVVSMQWSSGIERGRICPAKDPEAHCKVRHDAG